MSDVTPPNVPPTGGTPQFDRATFQSAVKGASRADLALIGAAVLLLIFSFTPYYKVSISMQSIHNSATGSAWHGFFGWAAVILALVGALLLVLPWLGVTLPTTAAVVTYGLFVVAFVFVLLALFVVPGDTGGAAALGVHIDKGHGFGYWISLLIALVAGAYGALKIAQSRSAA